MNKGSRLGQEEFGQQADKAIAKQIMMPGARRPIRSETHAVTSVVTAETA
jgi:hypothetical protein